MRWGLLPFKRYFEFSGRSRRKEYWWFVLAIFPLAFFAALIPAIVGQAVASGSTLGAIVYIVLVISLGPPYLAVSARRLHDYDMSGWWLLLSFVPFGGFVLFYFHLQRGTHGPNRFGPDPLGDDYLGEVFA